MSMPKTDRYTRPPFERMVRIHDRLSARTYPNSTSLAQALEVTPRTIKRDIEFMKDRLSLPIGYDPVKRGYYYEQPVDKFPAVNVSEAELFALLVAQKVVANYHGTPFQQPLQAAFHRMTSHLDTASRYSLENLGEALSFRPLAPEDADLRLFETLTTALRQRRAVTFAYRKLAAKTWKRRRVHPYHLACIENHWYLLAHDTRRKSMRTFALSRMRDPQLLPETFAVPASFRAEDYLRSSFLVYKGTDDYEVVIDFDAWATDLLRGRKWHASQQWIELPGGGARLRLRLNNIEEMPGWVLGWGPHATVVRPRALAERVRQAAEEIAGQYRG